jgi:hypothetical protein
MSRNIYKTYKIDRLEGSPAEVIKFIKQETRKAREEGWKDLYLSCEIEELQGYGYGRRYNWTECILSIEGKKK